jgi:hypothetical protein
MGWWVLFTALYFRKELAALFGKEKKTEAKPVAVSVMGVVTTPLPTALTTTETEEEVELDVDIEYEDDYVPLSDELPDLEDGFEANDGEDIDNSVTPPEVEHLIDTVQSSPTSVDNERKAAQTVKKIKDTEFFEQLQAVWGEPASARVTEAVAAWEKELQEMYNSGAESEVSTPTKPLHKKKNEVPENFNIQDYL